MFLFMFWIDVLVRAVFTAKKFSVNFFPRQTWLECEQSEEED